MNTKEDSSPLDIGGRVWYNLEMVEVFYPQQLTGVRVGGKRACLSERVRERTSASEMLRGHKAIRNDVII